VVLRKGTAIRPGLRGSLTGLLSAHQAHVAPHLDVSVNTVLCTEAVSSSDEESFSNTRNCHLVSDILLRGLSR
jgi:hypothetical protein